MPSGPHRYLRFGCFEIDVEAHLLRKSGVRIHVQEQPFAVLLTLLESPGQIVAREQLRQRLWPEGTFVEFDHALNTAVKKIRAALCDDAAVPRYIETIPRRGYRFLAKIETGPATQSQLNPAFEIAGIAGVRPGRSFRPTMVALTIAIPLLLLYVWMISRSMRANNVGVAVLPFTNINSDSTGEPVPNVYPELLRQLRGTHPAKVVIRNSAGAPVRAVLPSNAGGLQIDYVVQGSVVRDERHVRVAVQLVRLKDQDCVWARAFDRDLDNTETEIELAEEIVTQMQQPLASVGGEAAIK